MKMKRQEWCLALYFSKSSGRGLEGAITHVSLRPCLSKSLPMKVEEMAVRSFMNQPSESEVWLVSYAEKSSFTSGSIGFALQLNTSQLRHCQSQDPRS